METATENGFKKESEFLRHSKHRHRLAGKYFLGRIPSPLSPLARDVHW